MAVEPPVRHRAFDLVMNAYPSHRHFALITSSFIGFRSQPPPLAAYVRHPPSATEATNELSADWQPVHHDSPGSDCACPAIVRLSIVLRLEMILSLNFLPCRTLIGCLGILLTDSG